MAFCTGFLLTALSSAMSAEVPRMSKEELKASLEKGDVIVVDLRSGRDWKSSEFKIQKAIREDAGKTATWAKKYSKEKTLVLYCA
jgi:hypothetical protein